MVLKYLLDTNIILYFLGGRLESPLPEGEYFVSAITEIELLSYPFLDNEAARQIEDFLRELSIIDLREDVKAKAIVLRRQGGLKLPDAIIAATAQVLGAAVLTNDKKFHRVSGLTCHELAVKTHV